MSDGLFWSKTAANLLSIRRVQSTLYMIFFMILQLNVMDHMILHISSTIDRMIYLPPTLKFSHSWISRVCFISARITQTNI